MGREEFGYKKEGQPDGCPSKPAGLAARRAAATAALLRLVGLARLVALLAAALGFALAAAADHGVEANDGGLSELSDAVFHVFLVVTVFSERRFKLIPPGKSETLSQSYLW